jgi:hypothetical protein
MADYHSILAGAVRGLDPNTPAARRRLYERARSALISEMESADPPIPRSEIIIAQMALDTAIAQVEAAAALAALEKSIEHVDRDGAPGHSHRTRRRTRATLPMWSAEAGRTGKPDPHPRVEALPPFCASAYDN